MSKLAAASYRRFAFTRREDLAFWKELQRTLSEAAGAKLVIDGVPGPATVALLKTLGHPDGLWEGDGHDLQLLAARYQGDITNERLRAVVRSWAG
jgi:hypothetical protein